eukprot:466357-Amphidinium_carterae.1
MFTCVLFDLQLPMYESKFSANRPTVEPASPQSNFNTRKSKHQVDISTNAFGFLDNSCMLTFVGAPCKVHQQQEAAVMTPPQDKWTLKW